MFPIDILSRSRVPDCLPITGEPSISNNVYCESRPWIWTPLPPPKSGTIKIPGWSSKISLNLLELLLVISWLEMRLTGRGKVDNCLNVFVAVTITSSNFVLLIVSLLFCA